MKRIIAIGGGSFQKGETLAIDTYMIQCCTKKNPNILFLPTASRDDQGYAKRFKQYMRHLGCEVESLRLFHTRASYEEICSKILSCDILYIGAGNFRLLMQTLQDMKLQNIIRKAYEKGILCVGMSAGASMFFREGYSDLYDDGTQFACVNGIGILEGCYCPHAQDEKRINFIKIKSMYEKVACPDGDAYIMEDNHAFYFSQREE